MSSAVTAIKETLERVKAAPGLAATLADSADLINEVGLDSLEILQFMLQLEAKLAIRIDFDRLDYSDLNSIARLAAFLEQMPAQARPPSAR